MEGIKIDLAALIDEKQNAIIAKSIKEDRVNPDWLIRLQYMCVRSSGMAHFDRLIWPTWEPFYCPLSSRQGFLAAPAGAEPGDARRAAPFRRSGRRGGQKQRAPAARITSSSSSPAFAENETTRYPSR